MNLDFGQIEDLVLRLAHDKNDAELLMQEGEFHGFNHSACADRFMGYADWVGFLPSRDRAVWVSNGDPVWFDASSLKDAVRHVESGVELINGNAREGNYMAALKKTYHINVVNVSIFTVEAINEDEAYKAAKALLDDGDPNAMGPIEECSTGWEIASVEEGP